MRLPWRSGQGGAPACRPSRFCYAEQAGSDEAIYLKRLPSPLGLAMTNEKPLMNVVAKLLIGMGALLFMAGICFALAGRIPGLGKLPGDIFIKKDNFTFYFPLATCLLISAMLSLIFFFLNRR